MTYPKIIPVQNTFKVIDIFHTHISDKTFDFLEGQSAYRDQVLNEHLINVSNMVDDPKEHGLKRSGIVWKEINALHELCLKYKAAYIRFVTM